METVENIGALTYEELLSHCIFLQEKLASFQIDFAHVNFTCEKLKSELEQLKKLVFGSKHERFISATPPHQLQLDLNVETTTEAPTVTTQEITYTREQVQAKPPQKATSTRMVFPAHLPRKVYLIEPLEDVSGMKKIGEEITEILEIEPARAFIIQFVRSKYVCCKEKEGKSPIVIGELPPRIIPKGLVGDGLLAQTVIDKFVDHLPLYRQVERYKRMGVQIPMSTLTDWVGRCCQELIPLYEKLKEKVLTSGYLQVDETTIKVLDQNKKGKTHVGYYWVYHSPRDGLSIFDYRSGRSAQGPSELLNPFKGYLQTDGYGVYNQFGKERGITHLCCMAHARRKFIEVQATDTDRATYALTQIQKLYDLERQADEEEVSFDERKKRRETSAAPILKEFREWLMAQSVQVPPRSKIGRAIAYSLQRWEKLTHYVKDGQLKIDNNLVENAIRPVALGRKNYLFAGSHAAAQRAAMIYSLLNACKVHQVNPFEWLRDVFTRLPSHPINRIEDLLPHRWKIIQENSLLINVL